MFQRFLAGDRGALPQEARAAWGWAANVGAPQVKTTNADHTMSIPELMSGALYYDSLSAGRAVTTPTAALILAANPAMDIGDSFVCLVSIEDAFALTWVAGVGVTLAGRATTPASVSTFVVVTKTAATTVTWFVM